MITNVINDLHSDETRGALATFAAEGACRCYRVKGLTEEHAATAFSEAFPGIKPHLLTMLTNLKSPFYRDIPLALGICSASRESCSNILKGGPGSAIAVVIGGDPGTTDLTLKRRFAI